MWAQNVVFLVFWSILLIKRSVYFINALDHTKCGVSEHFEYQTKVLVKKKRSYDLINIYKSHGYFVNMMLQNLRKIVFWEIIGTESGFPGIYRAIETKCQNKLRQFNF